jgi:hypothetical protein
MLRKSESLWSKAVHVSLFSCQKNQFIFKSTLKLAQNRNFVSTWLPKVPNSSNEEPTIPDFPQKSES